jgi:protein-S-isoprenylcysteine O-methyltransferase Ste14
VIATRYACLLVPAALVVIGLRVERGRDERAAALLASVSAAVGIAALDAVARPAGWWSFAAVDGVFRGMPVDLWLGWAALWGAIPVLVRRLVPVPLALGLLLWLDLMAMPRLAPLLVLGDGWWVGEAAGIVAVAAPSVLLGVASAERRWLTARVLGQVVVFAGLSLWLVPTVAFTIDGASWQPLLSPAVAQVALLVSVPALLAVRELLVRGRGTPYPWDPPTRLVTTGPYAYVANPMQLSTAGLMLLMAGAAGSWSLAVAAGLAVAFGAGVAGPHESAALTRRHGEQWREYRRHVRDWWPRWTPYVAGRTATLWLDDQCGLCGATMSFFRRRAPYGLVVAPAATHPGPLWRAEYAGGDGHTGRGVAAVARGLEHVNLGWAYAGWFLQLPGIGALAQLVTDALIAPPHRAGTVEGDHDGRRDVRDQAAAARRRVRRHQ